MRGQFALNHSESSEHQEQSAQIQEIRGHAEEAEQGQFSRFLKFRTMAKLWSMGIVLAVVLIVVLGILAESFTSAQKAKPKVLIKRRKGATTVTTTTVAPTVPTTVAPLPDLHTNDLIVPEVPVTARNIRQEDSSPLAVGVLAPNLKSTNDATLCPPICELEKCPTDFSCPFGLVHDRCSCCSVCAVGEGSRCYTNTEPTETIGWGDGICGPGLLCSARMDLEPGESVESLCECRNTQNVCGSDNVTYTSECKLREAAHLKRNLTIASWSSCITAPWLTTPMENATGGIGTDLSVSCEFRAFPAALIHWEFSADGSSQRVVLPGDDSSIIQTHRGGPEELMTTTWIQIVSVAPRHQGTYHCIAKNSAGMIYSSGTISVYNEHRIGSVEKL